MSGLQKPFLTHEVGSLRKPAALLTASRNRSIPPEQLEQFDQFCNFLGYSEIPPELAELLIQAGPDQENNTEYHYQINRWRVRLNVEYKESTGIDLIDAGEWIRREMYQHLFDTPATEGVQLLSHVRSFDYNFYRTGVHSPPMRYHDEQDIYVTEFKWAKEFATKPLKVCLTAFNTAAEWSLRGRTNFDDFMFDLVDEIFVPETIKLLKAGANWLQMDEPALTTYPQHVDTFLDAWNYWVDQIKPYTSADTVLSLHNCFSNYDLLWPILPEMKDLGAYSLEFANRDSWELGTDTKQRKAYAEASKFIQNLYQGETGFTARAALGVQPVHTTHVTSPELIRDRLLYINTIIDNPKLVLAAPDCGLRQRTLPFTHQLLKNLTQGAELARQELGA